LMAKCYTAGTPETKIPCEAPSNHPPKQSGSPACFGRRGNGTGPRSRTNAPFLMAKCYTAGTDPREATSELVATEAQELTSLMSRQVAWQSGWTSFGQVVT
jgi:hypothetical protein